MFSLLCVVCVCARDVTVCLGVCLRRFEQNTVCLGVCFGGFERNTLVVHSFVSVLSLLAVYV